MLKLRAINNNNLGQEHFVMRSTTLLAGQKAPESLLTCYPRGYQQQEIYAVGEVFYGSIVYITSSDENTVRHPLDNISLSTLVEAAPGESQSILIEDLEQIKNLRFLHYHEVSNVNRSDATVYGYSVSFSEILFTYYRRF